MSWSDKLNKGTRLTGQTLTTNRLHNKRMRSARGADHVPHRYIDHVILTNLRYVPFSHRYLPEYIMSIHHVLSDMANLWYCTYSRSTGHQTQWLCSDKIVYLGLHQERMRRFSLYGGVRRNLRRPGCQQAGPQAWTCQSTG